MIVKKCFSSLFGVLLLVASATGSESFFTWDETAEVSHAGMASTLGDAVDQHGWQKSGAGSALVSSNTVKTGTQALSANSASLVHTFDVLATNVTVSFWTKPFLGDPPSSYAINQDAAVVFYVLTNGHVVAYSNQTPIELTALLFSDDWVHFEIQHDYPSQTWSLKANGTNIVSGFGFYSNRTSLSSVEFNAPAGGAICLDDIAIRTPSSGDLDGDGMSDEWETDHFGTPDNAEPYMLAENGINTLPQAYVAGLDPTDPSDLFEITKMISNVIYWEGVTGRVYTVYWSSNLLSAFNLIGSEISGSSYTNILYPEEAKGFYKIEVELQ